MTLASWDAEATADDAFVMTGSYTDDSVWSWSADYPGYVWTGSLRQNLSRSSQIDAEDGSYWSLTSYKPDGESVQEWNGDCSDYYCEGESIRRFDGTLDSTYSAFDGDELYAESVGAYAYDGSGVETITFVGGPTCEYTTDESGDCDAECDDGTSGSC
jgi:hypothetical protein